MVNVYKWTAGYLTVEAVLIGLQATVGHGQWNMWAYLSLGGILLWFTASIHGFRKGWLDMNHRKYRLPR